MRLVRLAGLTLGLLVMAGGLGALFYAGAAPGVVFVVEGMVIVVGILFERVTYKALEPGPPTGDWRRTGERFVDDASGRLVTVYVQSASGERKYVADQPAQGRRRRWML